MNEQEVQELFGKLRDANFNVQSVDQLKSALSDDTRRKKMYDFLTQKQGFRLGDFERFKYDNKVTPDATVENVAAKSDEVAPTVEASVKVDPIAAGYKWDAVPNINDPDVLKPLAERLQPADRLLSVPYAEQITSSSNPKATELALKEIQASNPVGDLAPINEEAANKATNFVSEAFGSLPAELQGTISSEIARNPKALSDESYFGYTDRQKFKIAEQAINENVRRQVDDLATLQARIELKGKQDLAAITVLMENLSREDLTDEQRGQIQAKIEEYQQKAPDEFLYLDGLQRLEQSKNAQFELFKAFPEELKRQKKLEAKSEKFDIQTGDGAFTKATKQMLSTYGAVQNTGIDALTGLLRFSSNFTGLPLENRNTATVQQGIDAVTDFADLYLKKATDTRLYDADGNFQTENFLPAVGATMADMAILIGGGSALGGGKAGVALSGMLNSYGDYYGAAKEKGLTNQEAGLYGLSQATISGLLETISPNIQLQGTVKKGIESSFKKLLKDYGPKEAIKHLITENIGEQAQEFSQSGAEKLANAVFNQVYGSDFDTTISREEGYETAILTLSATTLLGALGGKAGHKEQSKKAIEFLQEKQTEFKDWLQTQVEAGNVDFDLAQKAVRAVEGKQPPELKMAEQLADNPPTLEDIVAPTEAPITEPTPEAPAEAPQTVEPTSQPKQSFQERVDALEGKTVVVDGKKGKVVVSNERIGIKYDDGTAVRSAKNEANLARLESAVQEKEAFTKTEQQPVVERKEQPSTPPVSTEDNEVGKELAIYDNATYEVAKEGETLKLRTEDKKGYVQDVANNEVTRIKTEPLTQPTNETQQVDMGGKIYSAEVVEDVIVFRDNSSQFTLPKEQGQQLLQAGVARMENRTKMADSLNRAQEQFKTWDKTKC